MPGKRARRHFSQLSEFERGLIIGVKTAGWSTRHAPGQVDRSECAVRNCWEQWRREVTRSTIRADVGVAIVPQTISRHLAEANLKSKCPFRALPLTPEHRQLRLQWCQGRSMWNVTDWQKVVFSDESRFVLGTDDNRVRVWRRPGPFLNGLPGAIFQQDNALPHTARVAHDFLRHFQTLPWPARSPDLSPVEHLCD
ncbi:transposable element Tc1 transposase [Trichonephila clavipes]|nr:transposable element Tc1 transposase [Trichonephila clavipes]